MSLHEIYVRTVGADVHDLETTAEGAVPEEAGGLTGAPGATGLGAESEEANS